MRLNKKNKEKLNRFSQQYLAKKIRYLLHYIFVPFFSCVIFLSILKSFNSGFLKIMIILLLMYNIGRFVAAVGVIFVVTPLMRVMKNKGKKHE